MLYAKPADSLHKDEVWSTLTKSWFETQEILQHRDYYWIDHLPEGKHYSITDTIMINETASVPTSYKCVIGMWFCNSW